VLFQEEEMPDNNEINNPSITLEEIAAVRERLCSWAASLDFPDDPIHYAFENISNAEYHALILAVRGDPNWRKL
jgi:hypothetical protein